MIVSRVYYYRVNKNILNIMEVNCGQVDGQLMDDRESKFEDIVDRTKRDTKPLSETLKRLHECLNLTTTRTQTLENRSQTTRNNELRHATDEWGNIGP